MPSQPGPIPEAWRKAVLRILETGKFGHQIQLPRRTGADWQAGSLGSFLWDLRNPLIDALAKRGVIGKHIPDQPEPGETYAFWMYYQCANGENRKFYAKVCLHRGNVTIKVLSAHLPDKGDEL